MSLATMKNNLLRFVPGLHPEIIESCIQDAYRQLATKDWNRLKLQRQITTVGVYDDGTVSIDADGVVTGDETTFTSAMEGRFMKVYYDDAFFEIETYTSGTSITLKDWTGEEIEDETYEIFKTIYTEIGRASCRERVFLLV